LVAPVSVWFLVPSYYSFFVLPKEERNNLKLLEQRMPKWAPSAKRRLNLGLDLQGGIYMVMRVDTKTALQKRVERRALQMVSSLSGRRGWEVTADPTPDKLEVTVKPKDPATKAAVQTELTKVFGDFSVAEGGNGTLVLTLRSNTMDKFREDSVDQAML